MLVLLLGLLLPIADGWLPQPRAAAACWLLNTAAPGQDPGAGLPGEKSIPVVIFDMALSGAAPAHYSVSVESNGKAVYRCDDDANPATETPAPEAYQEKLAISSATAKRIFELAQQSNYFRGEFDYRKGHVANTGAKTLTYAGGPENSPGKPTATVRGQATYNYSENPSIQQLTTIFENISNTVELGRRLRRLQRFDKLGLDAELKSAEDQSREHRLLEMQLIFPTLQNLADDANLLHLVRQRAQQLLKQAEAEQSQSPVASSQ